MRIQEEKNTREDTGWDCCGCAKSLLVTDENRNTNQLERRNSTDNENAELIIYQWRITLQDNHSGR